MRREGLAERVCLAIVVGAAIVALPLVHRLTVIWALLAPCALAIVWRIPRVPAPLVGASRIVLWGLLIGMALLQSFLMTNQMVIVEPTAARGIVLLGYGLASLSCLFLLGGPEAFAPGKTLFPAVIGTFIVAAFGWREVLLWPVAAASAALMAIPLAEDRAAALRRRPVRAALAVVAVAGIAAGTIQALPPLQDRLMEIALDFEPGGSRGAGFGNSSRLGDIEELKLSDAVVLRVFSPVARKLRARAFVHFDGATWRADAERTPLPEIADGGELASVPGKLFRIAPSSAAGAAPGAAGSVEARIFAADFGGEALPVPEPALLARVPVAGLQTDACGALLRPPGAAADIYGVVHALDEEAPGAAAEPPAPELLAACLALPDNTDLRFRALAADLAAGAATPEQRLHRTVEHVRGAASYSLEVGTFKTRQPAAEFLFEKKRGYCQYFAAAAAILLRLEGIPCRYVVGFNVSEASRQGGHLVVRELDAHAWLEAYVPGRGWVEADPTPLAEFASLHAGLRRGALADALEWARGAFARAMAALRHQGFRAILGELRGFLRDRRTITALGVIVGAFALRTVVRRLRSRRGAVATAAGPVRGLADVPPDLVRLLARLDGVLARRGAPRAPSRAPLEHIDAIPPEKLDEPLRRTSRGIVEAYYRACFAGERVETAEIHALARALEG